MKMQNSICIWGMVWRGWGKYFRFYLGWGAGRGRGQHSTPTFKIRK